MTVVRRQQEIMQELVKDIRAIERSFASRVITPAVEGLARRFENPAVTKYLQQVAEHMLSHLDRFREAPAEGRPAPDNPLAAMTMASQAEPRFPEYQVNLLVDNAERQGAPVISENAPDLSQPVRHHRALGRSDGPGHHQLHPHHRRLLSKGASRLSGDRSGRCDRRARSLEDAQAQPQDRLHDDRDLRTLPVLLQQRA